MKLILIGPIVAVLSALGAINDSGRPELPTQIPRPTSEAAAFDVVIRAQVTDRMVSRDLDVRRFSRVLLRPRWTYRHEYVKPPQDTRYVRFRVYRTDLRGKQKERLIADGRVDRRTVTVELAHVSGPRAAPQTFVPAAEFIGETKGLRVR